MSLEKLGITLQEEELKRVKTNKDLAVEQLETIIGWMREKDGCPYCGDRPYLEHYASMIESQLRWLK